MLLRYKQTQGFFREISKRFKKSWERVFNNLLFWLGYRYLKKQESDLDSSSKTLKQQLAEISFLTSQRIKVFSLLVRIFIASTLFLAIGLNIYFGLYSLQQGLQLFEILVVYTFMIFFFLYKTRNFKTVENMHNFFDLSYVTMEIVAVYIAILLFPKDRAAIYTSSLSSFWFILIVLSVFTGKWYYGFYTGFLVAILNSSFLYWYQDIASVFSAKQIDFYNVVPKFQVIMKSIYYFITGALVSFPFWLFNKQQSLAINIHAENIIARPYYELYMQEDSEQVGEYLITKIITSSDIVGADYVSLKKLNNEEANIVIGDTIGHGLNRSPGAIITMSAFMSTESVDPLEIQNCINRVLNKVSKDSGGKTYCLSLYLRKDGVIEYAGKLEALKLVYNNGTHEDLKQNGEILGLTEELNYTEKNLVRLQRGDMLIAQTDGVVFGDEQDDKTTVIISRINGR